MRSLRLMQVCVLLAVAAVLWLPSPGRSQANAGDRIQVLADPELQGYATAIQAICAYAAEQAAAAGLELPDTITVHALLRQHYPSFVTVRGDAIVFHVYRELDLGPSLRKPPWSHRFMKIRELMAAVLDVATDNQYPAITEMLAAVYLVPGLWQECGQNAWPQPYDYNDHEGAAVYTDRLESPEMVELSAETELASLAHYVAEGHGPAVLCAAMATALADEDAEKDAIRKLEDALVEATDDEGLRDWMESYRRRKTVEPEEDGSVLLFGFEDWDGLGIWDTGPNFVAELGPENVTQGDWAMRLEVPAGKTGWSVMRHIMPRWRFGDWRGFSALALDIYNHNPTQEALRIELHDCHRRSHGRILLEVTLAPETLNEIMVPFADTRALAEPMPGDLAGLQLYTGGFRFESVGEIALVRRPDAGPIVLDIDNVRLVP